MLVLFQIWKYISNPTYKFFQLWQNFYFISKTLNFSAVNQNTALSSNIATKMKTYFKPSQLQLPTISFSYENMKKS